MFNHGRIGLTTCVALALAVFLPSTAGAANRSHFLSPYKVEQHVDVGDGETIDISCNSGDYAIEGMWRIDHVDQDDEYLPFPDILGQGVHVVASEGDDTDPSMWHITFVVDAPQNVQAKVFVTCLPQYTTTTNGHKHQWQISSWFQNQGPPVAPGVSTTAPSQWDSASAANDRQCAKNNTSPFSGKPSVIVQPGFNIPYASGMDGRLVGSYPVRSFGHPDYLKGWTWAIAVTATPGGLKPTYSWRCLRKKTDPQFPVASPAHTHSLVIAKWVDNRTSIAPTGTLIKKTVTEDRQSCGQQYKGLLAGFWEDGGPTQGFNSDPWLGSPPWFQNIYFLGMDPRPKIRAFSFANTAAVNLPIRTTIVCWNDRTT